MSDLVLVERSRAPIRVPLLRAFSVLLIAAMLMLPSGAFAASGNHNNGFITAQSSMLTTADIAGVEITPILTVGDVLPNGYRFEAIPDGISIDARSHGKGGDDDKKHDDDDDDSRAVDIYVNHETAKVPFPYNTAAPTAANGENDFDNAQVSLLTINPFTAEVLDGSFAIPSSAGFQRFCSNYLATRREGFERDILFTSEESPDYVLRQEESWPPVMGSAEEREVGVVVALDVKTGEYHPIYGMGRHNHENAVPIPGYRDLVVLSGDDTFTSGPLNIPAGGALPAGTVPAQSELYSYIAKNTNWLLRDKGDLWAFVSDTPGYNDYYDFVPGSAQVVTGHFIKVPKVIATGINPNTGLELKSTDMAGLGFGTYPLPPTDGTWQRDLRSVAPVGVDGPQWVLEYWSALNNVFQFIRVEDIAYDKRRGQENTVYIVDSGRGTAGVSQAGRSTNGRVWKMVLDKKDPTKVTSLTIFVEGDDNPVKTLNEVHQPDNIETTKSGILLTEDPGSSQQFTAAQQISDPLNATTGRLWYVPFSGTPQVVVKIDQSADGILPINGGTDVDGKPNGNWGAWETTGIVDASAAFGPGAFLINVQAHSLWVEKADGDDNNGDLQPDFTYKREGGQLLLIRIPGL